jgi:fructokinase
MKKLLCFGEALIDMIGVDAGVSLKNTSSFAKHPGGAPANVAVGAARLGTDVSFIGMVGDDAFGHHLNDTLKENKVDTEGLCFSKEHRTSLAFVSRNEQGDREFVFFREPGADNTITKSDIIPSMFNSASVFHFGSISMIESPIKETLQHCLELAQKNNLFISFDPNLRMDLWPSEECARDTVLKAFEQVNLVKVSEEELCFLTGIDDEVAALKHLSSSYPNTRFLLTMGPDGSLTVENHELVKVPSEKVNCIDTTGAGDAFMAGVLAWLCSEEYQGELPPESMKEAMKFANRIGGLATTKLGAMSALPYC